MLLGAMSVRRCQCFCRLPAPRIRPIRPAPAHSTPHPYRSYRPAPLSTSPTPVFFDKVSLTSPNGETYPEIPAFKVVERDGQLVRDLEEEWKVKAKAVGEETLRGMMEVMIKLPVLDQMLVSAQRQGRINFYLPSFGEEGAVVGSASAWNATDDIFAAVREVGVLLHRNYPLPLLMGQVFASTSDSGTKGRQMACHYGATEERFHTLSSPIGTQIPQAAGAAYALKLDQQRKRTDSCVVCYLGDGAASQGDFHAGVNMASVLGGPIIFFVRNNGFAISTPVEEQYKSDGIASRGPGYGIPTVRVDGNDPLAVYLVCVEARRIAVENQRPVMVEAMTYRIGHHSTSDDSSAYRSSDEVESRLKNDSPISRFRLYLHSSYPSLWSPKLEAALTATFKSELLRAYKLAENEKRPGLEFMMTDVYEGMERPLLEQREELKRLVKKWGETKVWKKELEKYEGGKEAFLS